MSDAASRMPEPCAFDWLSDQELRRLSLWLECTPLPAWRSFDPAMPSTPVDTIRRLIAERHARQAVLETIVEFNGNVADVLKRIGVAS